MAGYNDITAEQLNNATPDYIKAQGTDALPQLLMILGDQIPVIIQPALDKLQKELIEKYQNTNTCPDAATLQEIINRRNNILGSLNKIGKIINTTTTVLTGISTALSILQGVNSSLDASKIAAKIAAARASPVPGPFASLVLQINETLDNLKFDTLGNSKLNKLKIIIDSTATPISLTSQFITKAITILGLIDIIIKKCSPNSTLSPISQDLINITEAQLIATQTLNNITYKGFIIEIQEVPFSPTVNRRKAVGKNAQGIPLIETELSFTTIPQILINELKLIIDRDNLKAY